MAIPSGSFISLKTRDAEWKFHWTGFDLDDCFDEFQIAIANGGAKEIYDFGPCSVSNLRQLIRFFETESSGDAAGGGFRNPDPRSYEIRKRAGDYNLIVRFLEQGLQKEFDLSQPRVTIDRQFLNIYDGREA